jgi:hypothetical protein
MKTSAQKLTRRPGARRQSGATIVEFAIVMPAAVLLVLGIIQMGLIFSAKEIINEGAFMAARTGAVQNADPGVMKDAMVRALVPFYQDASVTDDLVRLTGGLGNATLDTTCLPLHCFLDVQIVNPTQLAFDDFGVTSSAFNGERYIPNDNLGERPHVIVGPRSHLSIQDANALRIKVTYGYELKVPLMRAVFKAVMCGVSTGVDAFGTGSYDAPPSDCASYYMQGRVPIVAYATVAMQTPTVISGAIQ